MDHKWDHLIASIDLQIRPNDPGAVNLLKVSYWTNCFETIVALKKKKKPRVTSEFLWSECPSQCSRRCSKTQYRKPCMFFCQKCCMKCLCVPPGFYGNKGVCPCYNNWKTKRGGPKCPWILTFLYHNFFISMLVLFSVIRCGIYCPQIAQPTLKLAVRFGRRHSMICFEWCVPIYNLIYIMNIIGISATWNAMHITNFKRFFRV